MGNNSSALLIIDVQIGLVELMSAEVQSRALPKIKTLLTEARAAGIPVIYIQHAYSGRSRSAFRGDVDHDSGLKPISVPG